MIDPDKRLRDLRYSFALERGRSELQRRIAAEEAASQKNRDGNEPQTDSE